MRRSFLSADFAFISRFRQQIFFLSADSISKFLSSADLFFVSKCLCRCHQNDAHAGICRFAPAGFLSETFSPSAGAHFRFYHDSIRFAGPPWHFSSFNHVTRARALGFARIRSSFFNSYLVLVPLSWRKSEKVAFPGTFECRS